MAKVKGIFSLSGSIGDITFYQKNGKTYARKKSNLTGERIKSDPKFEKTRAAGVDFAYSSKLSKIIRYQIKDMLIRADKEHHLRFTSSIRAALKGDIINPVGEKKINNADLSVLNGFSFNKFSTVYRAYNKFQIFKKQVIFKEEFNPVNIFKKVYPQCEVTFGLLQIQGDDLNNFVFNTFSKITDTKDLNFECSFPIKSKKHNIQIGILLIEAMKENYKLSNRQDCLIMVNHCCKI